MKPKFNVKLIGQCNSYKQKWVFNVRFVLSAILIITLLIPLGQYKSVEASVLDTATHTCKPFVQVNDHAFGLGEGSNGSYSSEEGFEVLTSAGHLYLGMEADNELGARIWRTKMGVPIPSSQADWEEVAADEMGYPFSIEDVVQADHIDSLVEFDGYVYASTANGGGNQLGTRIFRSQTGSPNSWEDAISAYGAGFGTVYNMNFKDMQVFDGYLCGGTQNWYTGSQVWCTSNGTTWEQKNVSGFGEKKSDWRNVEVWSGGVFDNALYFGVQNIGGDAYQSQDDVARVYRVKDLQADPIWEEVFSGASGSFRTDILGDLNGYMYISVRSDEGLLIYRSPSGDSGSWSQVSEAGLNGDPNNKGVIVDGATTYNGALYVAVSNAITGFELWRTTGKLDDSGIYVDWKQVGGSGLGNPSNVHAQLVTFNGYLYVWTSNYATGQQVLRTECGIEETIPVTAEDVSYQFSEAVGAAVTFLDLGDVTQVTVRTYPGAWDQEGLSVAGFTPVKRHYEVLTDGTGYSVDITFAYSQNEFDESSIHDESVTYQALWSGTDWVLCPPDAQRSDPDENQVSCSGVSNVSKVTITGEAVPIGDSITEPNAVVLVDFSARNNGANPSGNWLAISWLVIVVGLLMAFEMRVLNLILAQINRNPQGSNQ